MKKEIIILDSESIFRNYVIVHLEEVHKIVVFEDILDKTIYFYCFMRTGNIIATKVHSFNNYSSFQEIYTTLAKQSNLQYLLSKNNILTIKPKEE